MAGRKKKLGQKYMTGRTIEPIRLRKGMSVQALMEVFGGMGFNARRLYEAARVWTKMIVASSSIIFGV